MKNSTRRGTEKLKPKKGKVTNRNWIDSNVKNKSLYLIPNPIYARISTTSNISYILDNYYLFKGTKAIDLLKFLPKITSINREGRGSYKVNKLLLNIYKTLDTNQQISTSTYKLIEPWINHTTDTKLRIYILECIGRRNNNESLSCLLLLEITNNIKSNPAIGRSYINVLRYYILTQLTTWKGYPWGCSSWGLPEFVGLMKVCRQYIVKKDEKLLYTLMFKDMSPKTDLDIVSCEQPSFFTYYLSIINRRLTPEAEMEVMLSKTFRKKEYIKHLQTCREAL
jgi:hypothetical protein